MTETQFRKTLLPFLPEHAILHCYLLWKEHRFILKIKNKRATKLGDYRFDPQRQQHVITVNNDLNPFSFLITYVHEVAHLVTYSEHKRNVKPHGREWKNNFRRLMWPLLNPHVFPDQVLRALAKYLKNPKASSCNDHDLMRSLRAFDERKAAITLHEISPGGLFRFRERVFRREDLRRTRYVCCEVSTRKKYLISRMAEVEPVTAH